MSSIVVAPRGARPSYAHGYYTRDNAFYIAWDRHSREREPFLAWMRKNVLDAPAEMMIVAAARALVK